VLQDQDCILTQHEVHMVPGYHYHTSACIKQVGMHGRDSMPGADLACQ
jgi:hypothetical protein